MPANLTPEYKAAEAAFRKARDPQERLEWLREMLQVNPQHKGTDHLQADIKRRIKNLAEELERPKKGGARWPGPGRASRRRAARRHQPSRPTCTLTSRPSEATRFPDPQFRHCAADRDFSFVSWK
jgi:hypothetical protein